MFAWVPETYGEWAYVLAETIDEAKAALEASKGDKAKDAWDYDYHIDKINEFLKRPPDEVYERGSVIFGEVA